MSHAKTAQTLQMVLTVYWMKIKAEKISRRGNSASENESGYSVATFLVRMWIIIMKNIFMRIEKWFENDLLTILSFISIEKHGSNGWWFKYKWEEKHKYTWLFVTFTHTYIAGYSNWLSQAQLTKIIIVGTVLGFWGLVYCYWYLYC